MKYGIEISQVPYGDSNIVRILKDKFPISHCIRSSEGNNLVFTLQGLDKSPCGWGVLSEFHVSGQVKLCRQRKTYYEK